MRIQPVIKWSGSKRSQVDEILRHLPTFNRYFEPFIGGGSMLYAVNHNPSFCGDLCVPLIDLWNLIKNEPEYLAESYRLNWEKLIKEGGEAYYQIRESFNKDRKAENFLFLSRTCANGLIRFNSKGEFNSPFHLTRNGIKPDTFRKIVLDWSNRIQNAQFQCGDYQETTKEAQKGDFIYLDPPYFNTKGMYGEKMDFERFLNFLEDLNQKEIKFALSYDGVRDEEELKVNLPKELFKRHFLIKSGNSSFNRLFSGKNKNVSESLYLNY